MKKYLFLLLILGLAFSLVFAGGKGDKGSSAKLICGVTEFEPMNYRDSRGNWTGFDTELAQLVGQKLGMTVEFQEIEWPNKYQELEA